MILRNLNQSAKSLGLPRRQIAYLIALGAVATIFEATAVMMILPALEFIQNHGVIPAAAVSSLRWRALDVFFTSLQLAISLGGLLLLAFGAVLARQAAQYAQRIYTSKSRSELVKKVRKDLFSAILTADLATIESEATGRMINDFTIEVDTAASAIFFSLQIVALVLICAVYLASLAVLSPAMTALSLSIFIILTATVRKLFRETGKLSQATVDSNQEIGAFLVERVKSLRLIRLSGTEIAERRHADLLLSEQNSLRIRVEKIATKLSVAIEPAAIGFAFFCLWFGSVFLGLGIETLGIFLVIVLRLVPISKDLLGARQVVTQTQASLDSIEGRLTQLRFLQETDHGQKTFVGPRESIAFEDIYFHHGDDSQPVNALNGVSVSLFAGKFTALVGPSGGGKSTFIDLLPKLRRPKAGQILVDGTPIDEFDLESLRNGIAFIPQTAQVFDVTAAEHIRYGRPDATLDEVEDAARKANAFDFISRLPNGFDSRLGEGGSRLSGGQRQRLDLARAIARRAPVLVLDEPTSALDAESEREFQDALDSIINDRKTTVLVIVHRLSNISHADHIVVMENGHVTDVGTHEQLLRRGGWYTRAWSLQARTADDQSALLPYHLHNEGYS